MREYLFRAKRIDNGEWVVGDLIRHYENQRRFIAYGQMAYEYTECGISRLISDDFNEVNPETIGQYTGLKDKNGNEIYEGDIVKIIDAPVEDDTFTVEWSDGKEFCIGFGLFSCFDYEVIGNIHDKEESK